ncbi:hypothetical protein CJ030_MR2G016963 [Morella rubra]|uniref:Uncharacterized protein n=1 Tax=Morella rubra TaxID=262757 RepID=A0A6A1WHA0_9ROSI|nr:hypothetical protein CJ030_MR2G016963 [Morella rubra]
MGCSKPAESLPASKPKKAIEEIIKGRQLANQLRSLLNDSHGDDVLAPAKDLILKVLSSFTNSLTILSSDDVSQLQANTHGHKSKSSKGSCRNDISTIKDRRGRYKRRPVGFPTRKRKGKSGPKTPNKSCLNQESKDHTAVIKYPRRIHDVTLYNQVFFRGRRFLWILPEFALAPFSIVM